MLYMISIYFFRNKKFMLAWYAFLPFGQGTRGCIGMRFALSEAKLALANILRKYNLLPNPKTLRIGSNPCNCICKTWTLHKS